MKDMLKRVLALALIGLLSTQLVSPVGMVYAAQASLGRADAVGQSASVSLGSSQGESQGGDASSASAEAPASSQTYDSGEVTAPSSQALSAQAPQQDSGSTDEQTQQHKPVPGADGPTSPTNASTHLDIDSSDLLSPEEIMEAQINPSAGQGRVTFGTLLIFAEQYLGVPYVWGGKDINRDGGFDCSGFVNWVFNHVAGTNINSYLTNAASIYSRYTTPISEANAQPGDIVFFKGTYGRDMNYITHVGIYCGNGIMIDAGDPIGYDRVTDIHNVYGRVASRVYGRMKGVTVEQRGLDLGRFAQLHVSDAVFNGSAATPSVQVFSRVAGTTALRQGVDYDVSFKNNTGVGTGWVTVTGKGRYSGSLTKSFDILNPQDVVANGTYEIASTLGGSPVLDIANGSLGAGARAQLYSRNGTDAQRFVITREGSGFYTIKNAKSGLFLASASASDLRDGVKVTQQAIDWSPRTQWMIKKQGSGYLIASAADSSIVIDVPGASNRAGTGLQVYGRNNSAAQVWSLKLVESAAQTRANLDALARIHASDLADGYYLINTANSSSAVIDTVGGGATNGTRLQLYGINKSAAQIWRVTHDSKGYVTLANVRTGLAFDVSGGSTAPGTRVQLWESNGVWAQKWIAVKSGSHYSLISGLDKNLRLAAAGGKTANGTAIVVNRASGGKTQSLTFRKSDDSVEGLAQGLTAWSGADDAVWTDNGLMSPEWEAGRGGLSAVR